MDKRFLHPGFIVGILGVLAGIYLVTQGDWMIGCAGTMSSAGLAYFSYQNAKKQEHKTD